VPISESAKNLITKILNLDPARRPTLDEIMAHPFMNNGGTIPKQLPLSTLACPPSASYMRQFQPQGNTLKSTQQPQKMTDNSPMESSKGFTSVNGKDNKAQMTATDKFTSNSVSAKQLNPLEKTTKEATGTINQAMIQTTKDFSKTATQNFKSSANTQFQGFTLTQSGPFTGTQQNRGEIYVKRWVDYSTKYGLGYVLSNGSSGVFFNDSTKIILDPKGSFFQYIERRTNDKSEVTSTYDLTNYPKDLQKKVTLLQHFKGYLEPESADKEKQITSDENPVASLVFVKKWLKTKHAIMFRLTNKIVQVDFTDKTEIILSSEQKVVTYVNKKGERMQYPLSTALESSNLEMAKRLKYTKDILTNMVSTNQPGNPEEGTQKGGDANNPITERA